MQKKGARNISLQVSDENQGEEGCDEEELTVQETTTGELAERYYTPAFGANVQQASEGVEGDRVW
ncbi:hypothetical protein L917_14831 [Phytophthora nicotianae]|uniref:Uncharacterized protein n=1 Tax=Phytophthora nicotianae TaxID=4792 RepID=W2KMW2_PHYNI|nr:hypothetical protein L917_14831 [Phytophthora nicotianae]ETM38825.1 hypothetical protein L914_14966 [Phytophthora nicotianae]